MYLFLLALTTVKAFTFHEDQLIGDLSLTLPRILDFIDTEPSFTPNFRSAAHQLASMLTQTSLEGSPEVGTFKYPFSFVDPALNLGISATLQADAALGYELPLFSVYTDRHNIGFNPQVYLEFASHNFIAFHLGWINLKFDLDLNVIKFTPFDFQFLLSL